MVDTSSEIIEFGEDDLVSQVQSLSITSKLADELDILVAAYFELFDKYQQLREDISNNFSDGFMSLAQANFTSSNRKYGQESYDQRMQALNVLKTDTESEGYPILSLVDASKAEDDEWMIVKQENEVVSTGIEDEDGDGIRQRKGVFTNTLTMTKTEEMEKHAAQNESEDNTGGAVEEIPKVNTRDPLRWFGILRPPALASAQKSFKSALPNLIELVNIIRQIEFHESRIQNVEKSIEALKAATANEGQGAIASVEKSEGK